jgi:hypothetical protein
MSPIAIVVPSDTRIGAGAEEALDNLVALHPGGVAYEGYLRLPSQALRRQMEGVELRENKTTNTKRSVVIGVDIPEECLCSTGI